jgi:hypothetical protein
MSKARGAESSPPSAPAARQPMVDMRNSGGGGLWLWVGAGFLFVAILWTAMFTAVRHVDTRTVPLAPPGGRP